MGGWGNLGEALGGFKACEDVGNRRKVEGITVVAGAFDCSLRLGGPDIRFGAEDLSAFGGGDHFKGGRQGEGGEGKRRVRSDGAAGSKGGGGEGRDLRWWRGGVDRTRR